MTLSLTIPFFGYNSSISTKTDNEDPAVEKMKKVLAQKIIEADQLFLVNKYEDVILLLEEYKVVLTTLLFPLYDFRL